MDKGGNERIWTRIPSVERPAGSFALFPPETLRELEFSGLAWISAAIDRVCDAVDLEKQPLPKGIRHQLWQDPISRKLRSIDGGIEISNRGFYVFSKDKSKFVVQLSEELGGYTFEYGETARPSLKLPTPIKLVIGAFHRGKYPGMVESVVTRSII